MANYYVDSRKLVGDGTNEECVLTEYDNSYAKSGLAGCLQVGSSIYQRNESDYMINTNNTLSFYTTNFDSLKCKLSSGYTTGATATDITEDALISYRIHNSGTRNNFSCNGANKLKVLLVGGGGGGGGNTRSNNRNRRGKGGGGAGGLILFDVDLPSYTNNYYIEIGGGGNGSKNGDNMDAANYANDGQPTQFIISGWRVNANGGSGSKMTDTLAGTGGNTTTPDTLPTGANISILYSESGVGGSDGQGSDTGNTWGGRGGTYTFTNLHDFPSVIHTHANPNNNIINSDRNLVAQNNQGYNTNQRTNGYGIGGGGAGGSNKNNATTNVLPGAHGGDGLGIVFFRYD